MRGNVKFYNENKGYGFIETDGEDLFFHARDVLNMEILSKGDFVEFKKSKNNKGSCAREVQKL